jgi:AcrR family transcriptional regulator
VPASRTQLNGDDWIGAARDALIQSGIGGVKIDRLADQLGVTRGSFYWHFGSRADLLDALLRDWQETNTAPIVRAVEAAGDDGHAQFLAVVRVWIEETEFRPEYDAALRDWARHSPKAAALVRRVDARRIALLESIFHRLGYAADAALVRARVTYFHQVGYYALEIAEPKQRRLDLLPLYYEILSGAPMPRGATFTATKLRSPGRGNGAGRSRNGARTRAAARS